MKHHHTLSIEDYSRIMLEYTQRCMAGFKDTEDKVYTTSRSHTSRSHDSSQSGHSTSGILAGQAVGHSPSQIRHDTTKSSI
jgi:hypothetical protein